MIAFLSKNIGTIIVFSVLLTIISAAIAKMAKDKKSGKSPCGCDCNECGCCSNCRQ